MSNSKLKPVEEVDIVDGEPMSNDDFPLQDFLSNEIKEKLKHVCRG